MELHDAFADWLAMGPEGEPSRDLAIHASGCEDCMRAVATLDSLRAVDVGEASPPPIRVAEAPRTPAFGTARFAVATAAIIALGASVAIGGFGLLRQAPPVAVEPTDSPRQEGVLAGVPSPAAETATPTGSPSTIPSPSATPSDSQGDGAPTAAPIQTIGPPAATVLRTPPPQPTGQPLPTASPAPLPTALPRPTASPAPTATPPTSSPAPTPTEVPTASPTVAPDDCADGVDNDLDTLTDLADPDCVATGDESGTLP